MPDQLQSIVQRMIDAGEPEENIATVVQHFKAAPSSPRRPVSAEDFMKPEDIANRDMTDMDVVKGFGKGALRSAAGLVNMAAQSRMLPGVTPETVPAEVVDRFTPKQSNKAQEFGGTLETVAEMALPMLKGARAIPRSGRAAAKFQDVLSVAKDVPLNMTKPGNAALRVAELASHGGGTELGPGPVRQFIQYATNPKKPPMNYQVGQEFASNLSRLSADELKKLPPVIRREVGQLTHALRGSLTDAAETVGRGKDYTSAVSEYANAAKMKDVAKRALPLATGGGAAYLLLDKLLGGLK